MINEDVISNFIEVGGILEIVDTSKEAYIDLEKGIVGIMFLNRSSRDNTIELNISSDYVTEFIIPAGGTKLVHLPGASSRQLAIKTSGNLGIVTPEVKDIDASNWSPKAVSPHTSTELHLQQIPRLESFDLEQSDLHISILGDIADMYHYQFVSAGQFTVAIGDLIWYVEGDATFYTPETNIVISGDSNVYIWLHEATTTDIMEITNIWHNLPLEYTCGHHSSHCSCRT